MAGFHFGFQKQEQNLFWLLKNRQIKFLIQKDFDRLQLASALDCTKTIKNALFTLNRTRQNQSWNTKDTTRFHDFRKILAFCTILLKSKLKETAAPSG